MLKISCSVLGFFANFGRIVFKSKQILIVAGSVYMAPQICWNRRGSKACPSCGKVQGQRKLICSNENCALRQKLLAAKIAFDPVKLITNNSTAIFSLRAKERDAYPRNFAEITEITLSLEQNSKLVTRNAICYVESCKYDHLSEVVCKHIKACNLDVNQSQQTNIPNAEVYAVSREVLWNLNIDTKQKQRLWVLYNEDAAGVPAVQRLNATTFVVKCDKSKTFPAGRLHVTVSNASSINSKKPTHACACKMLKIILEPDNSVVMQEEVCEHLLLVLAAILSKSNGKHLYKNFTNSLHTFWVPNELEKPIGHSQEDFFGMDINIGDIVDGIANAADDIFIFDDKLLSNDNLPDLTDIVFDLTPADFMYTQNDCNPSSMGSTTANNNTTTLPSLLHAGDPKLVSSYNTNENDIDICLNDIISTAPTTMPHEADRNVATQLELSDCNIELMDQFQLTDRIDLDLEPTVTSIFNSTNNISVLAGPPTKLETPALAPITISLPEVTETVPYFEQRTISAALRNCAPGDSLLKANHRLPNTTTLEAPPIELPTIEVVKKVPLKATQIVSEIKTRKCPHIHAKRALIVNTSGDKTAKEADINYVESATKEPSLSYSAWLEYVIETVNESIDIVEQTDVKHTFHVHEEIFSHFSKSFSIGVKRRMPNSTKAIKYGKHKGLIKYVWYFPSSATVRRIFSTKNLSLEVERVFEQTTDGDFIPFVRQPLPAEALGGDNKKRRLYPKLSLYVAHIWFDCNDERKAGFKIEWLPNAFSKSHFGILTIEFSLGIKDPSTLGVTS